MDVIEKFIEWYQDYLNRDPELGRRLKGFKNFSGMPDGHYQRAREQGASAQVRAMRCYPFGGSSLLAGPLISITLVEQGVEPVFTVFLENGEFSVRPGPAEAPKLGLTLPRDLFDRILLGRYRWMWVIGMDEVDISWVPGLPHSDWITLLEILVVMQEMIEFEPDLLAMLEKNGNPAE